jgi:hypothetical protein
VAVAGEACTELFVKDKINMLNNYFKNQNSIELKIVPKYFNNEIEYKRSLCLQ